MEGCEALDGAAGSPYLIGCNDVFQTPHADLSNINSFSTRFRSVSETAETRREGNERIKGIDDGEYRVLSKDVQDVRNNVRI